jgi:hypothetical protein
VSRGRLVLPLLVLAALVNLPLVHSSWKGVRGDTDALLVFTLVADAMLVLVALLMWRGGGRVRRAQLVAVALEDVGRCPPGILLERLQSEDYLVRGEVVERTGDTVLLDVGNRTVLVHLDGHHNPVGHQQPAQVRARMVG